MVIDYTFQVHIQCRQEQWTGVTDPIREFFVTNGSKVSKSLIPEV